MRIWLIAAGDGLGIVASDKIRVLIADDHPAVRTSLHRLLNRQEDIQVVGEAENGKETLSMINAIHPDVLLLDIEMPVLDGIEVTRELHREKSAVRVLILSGYADDEYIRLVMEQGVFGYLVKDEPPARIADAIRTVADGKKIPRLKSPVKSSWYRYQGAGGNLG